MHWTRRQFVGSLSFLAFAGAGRYGAADSSAQARKMKISLRCGSIGVSADQRRAIDLAHRHGFEAVTPDGAYLAKQTDDAIRELQAELEEKQLVWGAAGLPVDFRRDDATYEQGLRNLPKIAAALQRAGATRVGTWLSPAHDELTYRRNFQRHVDRLRPVAKVLADHGIRFGLEYVGPKTSWSAARHAFIHTLDETLELIAAINVPNMGIVLDSWHWYTAQESVDDLRALTNDQIVACDLNDAPTGLEVDEQMDLSRELPAATGVIDVAPFLKTLVEIGYDGPVRAEPFNQALNQLDDEQAVAATARAMRKAFAHVDG